MTVLTQSLLCSQLLVVGLGAFRVNGYVYSSGPLGRNPHKPKTTRHNSNSEKDGFSSFESSPRRKSIRQEQQDCVSQAFRELQDEIGDKNRATVGGQLDWVTEMMGATSAEAAKDLFQKVDKNTSKKWVEKAFDLAFEFNNDFAAVPGEKDATDEILRKSRDWVARMYEDVEKETETEEATNDDDGGSNSSSSIPLEEGQERTAGPSSPDDKVNEVVSEVTPNSENRSNEELFRVDVDLPGVARTDIDITMEGDSLLLHAKRTIGSDDGSAPMVRVYTERIPFPENEVFTDKLDARLKNGVLVVTAPKRKPSEMTKRKIPIF